MQLRNVLEALAAVSYYVASPLETLLRRESANLPWGATLIVVTALVTENLLAELLRLREVGRRLALISLDDNWTPQPLPGIIVYRAQAPLSQPSPDQAEEGGSNEFIHSTLSAEPERMNPSLFSRVE